MLRMLEGRPICLELGLACLSNGLVVTHHEILMAQICGVMHMHDFFIKICLARGEF